ncbi:branched-chain amino acid ABC transporter permease [Ferrovibrio sp.]|uniref:branched-chain amino acid ABC transporter permease n=1 Tax=Ferrovibrio sp. TaxID=1917215 RepID=UPI00311FBE61
MLRLSHRIAVPLAVAVLVILPGLILPSGYYFRVGALVFISALAVIGLNLLMGYAGQVSLGHAGFFGIGAYSVAIGPAHFAIHSLLAALIGIVAAGLLAFLVGRPILRLKGHYLAVATLGLGILIAMVITNEAHLTGGPDGMPVQRLVLFGTRLRSPETWYWITGTILVLGTWIGCNIVNSPTGRALRALHDSEVATQVLGVDAARYKLMVFVISAIYAAIAGACLALLNGHITPDAAGFLHSIELVTMVVLGGMGSIFGSIVGAAILTIVPQVLSVFHEVEHLILGLIMIVIMIYLPAGIVPAVAEMQRQRRR